MSRRQLVAAALAATGALFAGAALDGTAPLWVAAAAGAAAAALGWYATRRTP